VLAAACFWGLSATLARFVFRDHQVPPLVVVELRLVLAVMVLLPWMLLFRRASLRVERRDMPYFLILGLFGVAAVQGSYYFAIARIGVGLAILLQYLAPTLIVLWDLARGRPVRSGTAWASVLALAGTGLLVGGVGTDALRSDPLGWAVGLVSAFIFAFYILYSKRGLRRYPPETTLLVSFSVAALFWMVVTPPWTILAAGYSPQLWGMFLALGLFSTLVPFALFTAGLHRLPAAEAGVLATSEPLIAVVAAAVFLGEALAPVQCIGAVLVLAAAVLASRGGAEDPGPLPGQA
jgi:drug/metabolite transporter (DMT)-like permease